MDIALFTRKQSTEKLTFQDARVASWNVIQNAAFSLKATISVCYGKAGGNGNVREVILHSFWYAPPLT
jgi:hypothetical protein